MHFLTGQKKLEEEHKDPDVLPKINKSDMAGTMESINEYLRSHCGVVKAPLAYVIKKSITVQTYCEYPLHRTPDDEMIARILHLPLDKNKLLQKRMFRESKFVWLSWIRSARISICQVA